MKKFTITSVFILVACLAFSATRNVPATYSTIQAALTACLAGDTVKVQPGTYTENIVWPNTANIKLYAAGDSSNTIINGGHAGIVLTFAHPSIDTNTVVKGFKITNGFLNGTAGNGGSGVQIISCSPKFTAVVISGNHLAAVNWGYGAGIYCSASSMIISNSSISENITDSASWGYGGGVYASGAGNLKFRNVKIYGNIVNSHNWNYGAGIYSTGTNLILSDGSVSRNHAGPNATWAYGAGIYAENAKILLTRMKIVGNFMSSGSSYYYGAGLNFSNCTTTMVNTLVAENKLGTGGSFYSGAGIYDYHSGTSIEWLKMINCTVANNNKADSSSFAGSGIYIGSGAADTIINSILYNPNAGLEMSTAGGWFITYTDIRGGATGTGNINAVPGFVSWHNYHLSGTSPCINIGSLAAAPSSDLDLNARPMPIGTNPDMGCYEFNCVPPVVAINLSAAIDTVCSNAGVVNLTGATPAGGTYSGTGVSGTSFNPATAGLGLHSIVYSYTNGTGCTGKDSATIFVHTCSAGINEYDYENSFIVYPNPATNEILVSLSESARTSFRIQIQEIKLVNVLGEVVFESTPNNQQSTLNIQQLSKGIYFIQIMDENKRVVNKKMIKE